MDDKTILDALKILNDASIPTTGRMIFRDGIFYEMDGGGNFRPTVKDKDLEVKR